MSESSFKREISSFVRREGRISKRQERAMSEYWPKLGLEVANGVPDYAEVFGNASPLVLEIGFGMGGSLVEMAKAHPELNYLGIEVHTNGVGAILADIHDETIPNLRIFKEDAKDVLQSCIANNSLSCIQVFFPDPWHKKKHNKRRLIQPEFVEFLSTKLQVGGELHLATDWQHYAEQMMEVMTASDAFINVNGEGEYLKAQARRPETKFERRGMRLGHGVWDLLFELI